MRRAFSKGPIHPLSDHTAQELLETTQARTMVESAEERGYIEPADLEALAIELDLAEDEIAELTQELESQGQETGPPGENPAESAATHAPAAPAESVIGAGDSLQLFL